MADRSQDWYRQAVRDLDQARDSQAGERHEWACFAAHQAAEVVVYTVREWEALRSRPGFGRTVAGEAVWVFGRG